ncbi:HNH endonuclease [Staphylococcus hominis]
MLKDRSKRLDMNNLEVVCFNCHNKIHDKQNFGNFIF